MFLAQSFFCNGRTSITKVVKISLQTWSFWFIKSSCTFYSTSGCIISKSHFKTVALKIIRIFHNVFKLYIFISLFYSIMLYMTFFHYINMHKNYYFWIFVSDLVITRSFRTESPIFSHVREGTFIYFYNQYCTGLWSRKIFNGKSKVLIN